MSYSDELSKAMAWLGEQPNTVFIGQQCRFPGNGLFKSLERVPMKKRIELGVAEDMQLGISIGLALSGRVPICVFPRFDFLMLAMNQLVNHLEHYPQHVIIRVCVGTKTPLDPGPQHSGDYTEALESLLKHVTVMRLLHPFNIMPAYMGAYASPRPWLLIEWADKYGME